MHKKINPIKCLGASFLRDMENFNTKGHCEEGMIMALIGEPKVKNIPIKINFSIGGHLAIPKDDPKRVCISPSIPMNAALHGAPYDAGLGVRCITNIGHVKSDDLYDTEFDPTYIMKLGRRLSKRVRMVKRIQTIEAVKAMGHKHRPSHIYVDEAKYIYDHYEHAKLTHDEEDYLKIDCIGKSTYGSNHWVSENPSHKYSIEYLIENELNREREILDSSIRHKCGFSFTGNTIKYTSLREVKEKHEAIGSLTLYMTLDKKDHVFGYNTQKAIRADIGRCKKYV